MSDVIWTPPNFDELHKIAREIPDTKVKMRGVIQDATYYPEEGHIAVQLGCEDGTRRSAFLHKSCFTFHGRPYHKVPAEDVDKEMARTTELFQRSKGRRITLEVAENQAKV